MHAHAGLIGPNAVTRLAEALAAQVGSERTASIFGEAGQAKLLAAPPEKMVDEQIVTALHVAMRHQLDTPQALRASTRAGELTADYLLANRIPRPVQALLRVLPAMLAARLLVLAIGRHAWTFAGSGQFAALFLPHALGKGAPHLRFSITGCLVCRGAEASQPACAYYAATFERLFRKLVHRGANVVESRCEACGDSSCEFDIRW